MNPRELMIGNKVKWKGEEVDFDSHLAWHVTELEPIQLTEDWLLKLGFQGSIHSGYGKDVVELNYITIDSHFQMEYRIAGIDRWFLVDVKYVHQLQNLYFALTGNELKL